MRPRAGVCLCTQEHTQKASWRGWTWAQTWLRDVCACCLRTPPDDSAGRMEDILEEVLRHREPEALQQYLRKVRALGWGPRGSSLPLLLTEGIGRGPCLLRGPQVPMYEVGAVLGALSGPAGLQLPRPEHHPFVAYVPARL